MKQNDYGNSCNRHDDCAAATKKWLDEHPNEHFSPWGFHCHAEDCEDCFGC